MLSKQIQWKHLQLAALLALLASAMCNTASTQQTNGRALPRLVSKEEGTALAQAALHHWPQMRDKPDCSHLVHDIYVEAGLNYEYAPTKDIFEGIEPFRRVSYPQAGDLVVWQGHVGIVIDPEDHSFFSSVITGVSVSSFNSSYWESRGPRRFYRYKITDAQSARLLQHPSYRKTSAAKARPALREPSYAASKKHLEANPVQAEPDVPEGIPKESGPRESGPVAAGDSRVAGAVVSAFRKPTKEEIRSAFVKFSEVNAAQLQQSAALNGPIDIVDGFDAGNFETQGGTGWAELNIRRIATFVGGKMIAANRMMKVRFTLLHQSDGWTLQAPASHSYLLRTAAVRMVTAWLAMLARDPGNAKDLKDLHRALGILLAEGSQLKASTLHDPRP